VLERIELGTSSLGRAYASTAHDACLRVGFTGRRTAARLVRERAAPWFVKPRRVSGESLRSSHGNVIGGGGSCDATWEESSTRRTGPQPRQEVSSKFSASWTRDVGDLDRDSEGSWLCSWAVSDCRSRREMSDLGRNHPACWVVPRDSSSIHMGLASWGFEGRKRCPKPARGGEVVGTVAGSR